MTVFILSEGERYEGGHVIGVYASLEQGLQAAEKTRDELGGEVMSWAGEWQETVRDDGSVTWTRSVDWLELRKWEVAEIPLAGS